MLFWLLSKSARTLAGVFLALAVIAGALGVSTTGASAQAQPPPAPLPTVQPQGPAPTPTAAPAPKPPADWLSYVGDILPQRERDLFVMRVDGSDKKQITQGFNVWFASWSPDGKRLAVTTEQAALYTLNPDGSDLKLLADGAYSPAFWSPDGHFIAYVG